MIEVEIIEAIWGLWSVLLILIRLSGFHSFNFFAILVLMHKFRVWSKALLVAESDKRFLEGFKLICVQQQAVVFVKSEKEFIDFLLELFDAHIGCELDVQQLISRRLLNNGGH